MAKKAATKHVVVAPQYLSWRHVPKEIGSGRVCLYDGSKGLPSVNPEIPEVIKGNMRWLLVHFPSRQWAFVKSKKLGLKVLDDVHKGLGDGLNLIPTKTTKTEGEPPARSGARASKETVQEPSGPEKPADEKKQEEEPPAKPKITVVPPDLDFDKAFRYVFPPARITGALEELQQATTPVYSHGQYCGEAPAHMVRLQALKLSIEYHQGRPDVKEKVKEVKQPLTLQELRAKMLLSDEYRAGILEMVQDCEKEAIKARTKS